MREKNASKRCTLYVKNFEPRISEDNIRELFQVYGDLESVKLFPEGKQDKNYAFVCFKTPDQATNALNNLHNCLINQRLLSVTHYELKEYRKVADEETRDKLGFQRYK